MPVVGTFPTIRSEIAGVKVVDLAKQFGTPTYIYDAASIVERWRRRAGLISSRPESAPERGATAAQAAGIAVSG